MSRETVEVFHVALLLHASCQGREGVGQTDKESRCGDPAQHLNGMLQVLEHVERGEILARVCVPRAPAGEPPAFSDTLIESLIGLIEARIGAASDASHVADAERPEAESDRTTA